MAGACCDNPSPRILEKDGRLFCGNCRRYLDTKAKTDQAPLPETPLAVEDEPPEFEEETEK